MRFTRIPQIEIDLTRRGSRRWEPLRPYRAVVHAIIRFAISDAGMYEMWPAVAAMLDEVVSRNGLDEELIGLCEVLDVPRERLLAANMYFDSLKTLWACTAFAVDTPAGPLHARNLDWVAPNQGLSAASIALRFNGPGREFISVGWPGMIGVLSGMAPGRFSVSLNAVASDEPPSPGTPLVFLLRRVLEGAENFAEAVSLLAGEKVCSDCILLVAGVRAGEMAIVERTPSRAAVIEPTDGALVATNHYQALEVAHRQLVRPDDEPLATSGDRHRMVSKLLAGRRPQRPDDALPLLRDPGVLMDVTLQQMAFQPAAGTYTAWRIPGR